MHLTKVYGTMTGLKSAGSLRTRISESLSSEGADPEGEGGRRRETTGFCATNGIAWVNQLDQLEGIWADTAKTSDTSQVNAGKMKASVNTYSSVSGTRRS